MIRSRLRIEGALLPLVERDDVAGLPEAGFLAGIGDEVEGLDEEEDLLNILAGLKKVCGVVSTFFENYFIV